MGRRKEELSDKRLLISGLNDSIKEVDNQIKGLKSQKIVLEKRLKTLKETGEK